MADTGLLAVGLGGIFTAFLVVSLLLTYGRAERSAVRRSLATVDALAGRRAAGADVTVESFSERVLMPMASHFKGLGARLSDGQSIGRLQRMLDRAGNPPGWTADRIYASKGLGLVGVASIGAFLGLSRSFVTMLLFAAAGGAAGFFLPDILLYNAGVKRQKQIQKSLPDSLDMLTVCVEAGLGFDAALSQVARNTEGPLSADFFRVLQEMQIGKSRTDAFRALGERTTVPELKQFVSALVQADSLGIPIAKVLREQAKEMRIKRRQRVEEKAQQVPVKILFPLVLFILPCLFVVIIGPGAIQIIKMFSGGS